MMISNLGMIWLLKQKRENMNLCLLYDYLNFHIILKLCNSCKKKERKKKNVLLIVVKTLVVVEKFKDYL